MGHWYDQQRDQMKLEKQDQPHRTRMEQMLLIWILVNLAGILMLLSGIGSYYLYRTLANR